MKNLDTFSRRTLIVGTMLMGVLLSASLFIFSISRLQANGSDTGAPPRYAFSEGTGKYAIAASQALLDDGVMNYNTFILNTETGECHQYGWSGSERAWKDFNPLPKPTY